MKTLTGLLLILNIAACPSFADVVFTEDFEESTLTDMKARWSNVKNSWAISFSSDVPPGSAGEQSIMMRHVVGSNTGAHLYQNFPEGYDTLYARFMVKFSSAHAPVHHFVKLGGYNPPSPWPLGNAGELPDGTDDFISGLEPGGAAWNWQFYTYWMNMQGDSITGYWGNVFHPSPSAPAPRDEWMSVEMMLTCNDPVTSLKGEQAFWINDEKAVHLGEGFPGGYWQGGHFYVDAGSPPFEGYQWRSTEELRLTFFWLCYYMTGGTAGVEDTVWFDDVVVSTDPIGTPSAVPGEGPAASRLDLFASPNPFGPSTSIHYRLLCPASVSLYVYDLRGRLLRRIERGAWKSAGGQIARWDGLDHRGRQAPPGVYFYSLTVDGRTETRKMVLLN